MGFSFSRSKIEGYGEKVKSAQRNRLMDAATAGYNWSLEQAPEDRGTLKGTSFPPEFRGNKIVWGYTQPYASAQEFGTRPYYPPVRPLLEWAERVFGNPSIGYAVQQKIAEEGIEEKRFARDGKERQKKFLKSRDYSVYLDKEFNR